MSPRRLLLALLSCTTVVCAQTDSPAPDLSLEPLIVTAQKRGQSIDEVPISITAYSGTSLDALGISRYQDLAPLVPGLFLSVQSPGLPGINLRGISSDSTDPRQDPRISIFQDGVAISRAAGSLNELFDLERIEVVKGPQGTLFGRDAAAGAISLTSRRPAAATETSLTLGTGNFGRQHASGYFNTPLGSDQLLGRVAFTAERRDGTQDNLSDGSDLNSRETVALRTSLRWVPSAATTFDLVLNFQRDTPAGIGFKSGVIPTSRGDTDPFTAAELNRGAQLGLDRTVWGATLLGHRVLSESWTLDTVTAWRAFDSLEEFDGDGSSIALIESNDDNRAHQLSQEVRLTFDNHGRFTGFVGLSATRERAQQSNDLRVNERAAWPFLSGSFRNGLLAAGVPAFVASTAVPVMNPFVPQTNLPAGFAAFAFVPPLAPLAALAGAPLKPWHTEQSSNSAELDAGDIFADGTWRVSDRLELTAGLRASMEQQVSSYNVPPAASPSTLGFILNASPNFAFATTPGRITATENSTGWAGRVAARYSFSSDLSAFASVARGRRPPTLIITSAGTQNSGEEVIVNTEVGLKGRAWAGRLAWSAAVFQYRYDHFVTFVQDPTNLARFIAADAGRATGRGGELSLRAALSRSVSAFATYGYTDATFDDTGADGTPQQFAGSTFRLTARHTAALGFTTEHTFADRGHFSFSPRWEYKSAHFFEDDNTRLGGSLRQPAFSLVHVRAAWSSPARRWEVVAFANNLLDEDYLIDAGNVGANFGIPTNVRGEPRLLGLEVTRRW